MHICRGLAVSSSISCPCPILLDLLVIEAATAQGSFDA